MKHCTTNAEVKGSNPVEAPKTFLGHTVRLLKSQIQLRWSHLHFIRMSAVHIAFMSRSLHGYDEFAKLACSHRKGSSQLSWWSTAALTQRPWVWIPKTFSGHTLQLQHAMITSSFHSYIRSSHNNQCKKSWINPSDDFLLLFSRLNYALALVLKVQVKLCTSMNLFSRLREREKLKWIKQWFDYFIAKKQTNKLTKSTLGWHFA